MREGEEGEGWGGSWGRRGARRGEAVGSLGMARKAVLSLVGCRGGGVASIYLSIFLHMDVSLSVWGRHRYNFLPVSLFSLSPLCLAVTKV